MKEKSPVLFPVFLVLVSDILATRFTAKFNSVVAQRGHTSHAISRAEFQQVGSIPLGKGTNVSLPHVALQPAQWGLLRSAPGESLSVTGLGLGYGGGHCSG